MKSKKKKHGLVAVVALLVLFIACMTMLAYPKQLLVSLTSSSSSFRESMRARNLSRSKARFRNYAPIHELRAQAMPYNLPPYASEWCMDPIIDAESSIDYYNFSSCSKEDDDGILNVIPTIGGLTNALKFILLGAIQSIQDNQCFMIDEENWPLRARHDPSQQIPSFLNRYFEPMGLSRNDTWVQDRIAKGLTQKIAWKSSWTDLNKRRSYRSKHSVADLHDVEGHYLKKIWMRRLWRLLPEWRHKTCRALDKHHGLHEEFMSFSIRRGDKKEVEGFDYAPLVDYIVAAEQAIASGVFDDNNKVPTIFVATDDCSVLQELRQLRTHWTFVSECDRITMNTTTSQHSNNNGFALSSMMDMTLEETDIHFAKFFVELYAMAISKYFIGVAYTNGTCKNDSTILSHHTSWLRCCYGYMF